MRTSDPKKLSTILGRREISMQENEKDSSKKVVIRST